MIPVFVDVSDFVEQSALTPEETSAFVTLLLHKLEQEFREKWMDQVEQNLHSTRAEYMKAMFTDHPNDNTVVMGVTARESPLAVMLELGADAFDEKVGFMHSSKRTLKRGGGWYLTVPFRHGVPTTLRERFTSVMPVSVYMLARRAAGRPLALRQLPASQQVKTVRPEIRTAGGKVYPAYQRKTARYEGLVRVPHVPERHGGYFTFRRVSDLSDQNSWIHPGLVPRNLLGKALNETDVSSVVRRARIDFFKQR